MTDKKGYYSVTIHIGTEKRVHTVFARSDYAAAVKVRNLTGRMAAREKDVVFVSCDAPVWIGSAPPPFPMATLYPT